MTRKITRGIAALLAGKQDKLYLGNLKAYRDWGFAGDYVDAMWLMLQADRGDDYVVATGNAYTVEDFLTNAFAMVGITRWHLFVESDPRYLRPTEVPFLKGNPSKIRSLLGWEPTVSLNALIYMMLKSDLEAEGLSDLSLP